MIMTQSDSKYQAFIKQNKTKLQIISLVMILVIPFLLYMFAQGGQAGLVIVFLSLMTLVMVGIILIS